MDFDLKLSLKNVPGNVVITTPLPSSVKVTLKDKAATLLSYRSSGGLPSVNIDFNNYDQQSGHVVLKNADIIKVVQSRLQTTTKVQALQPNVIEYFYNFGLHARFPVVLRASLEAEKLYGVSSVSLKPDSVTVFASREVLDTMTAVYTKHVVAENINKKTAYHLQFENIKGTKVTPGYTTLTVNVDKITEKTVEVPVRFVNFPASKVLRTFPSSVKVSFQVGLNMYKQITAADFPIVVSYDDVQNSNSEKLHLYFKSVPAGVSYVRIIPEYVDFLVEDVVEEDD